MNSVTTPVTHSVKCGSDLRWFHLWCLPAMWLVTTATLWCIVWLQGLHGERTWIAALAGWAELCLVLRLGLPFPAVTQWIVGVLLLGAIGLFQDRLHVSKRIVILYVAAPLASSLFLAIQQEAFDIRKLFGSWFLVHFAVDLHILAALSCLCALIWLAVCKVRSQHPAVILVVILTIAGISCGFGIFAARAWGEYKAAVDLGIREREAAIQIRAIGGRVECTYLDAPHSLLFSCFHLLSGYRCLRIDQVMLDGTPITDHSLRLLHGLKHLKVLSLENTEITDAAMDHLRSLTALEKLNLNGTRVTERAADKLRKDLPATKIRHDARG